MEHKIHIEEKLIIVFLLTFVGGFLDSYTYLLFDKIFANTQTGNLIFFSIYLTEGNFYQAFIRLMPILFFCIGIFLTQFLLHHFNKDKNKQWIEIVLILNIVLTFLIGIGAFKNHRITTTCIISFICATIIGTFKRATGHIFAPTMCTGNLRSCIEFFSISIIKKDKEAKKITLKYIFIIIVFCIGVSIGFIIVSYFKTYAILLCSAIFLLIFILVNTGKNRLK